jgi:hypothetical protein
MKRLAGFWAMTVSAGFVLMLTLGVGAATAAPPFYGQTYAKASATIKANGSTPAIATVIGSQVPTDDCVVTNAYMSITLDSTGRRAHRNTWMLELNCNSAVAQPGKPGNSVTTPEGKKAKANLTMADNLNTNLPKQVAAGKTPRCGQDAASAKTCMDFCDKSGLCSDWVVNYLTGIM